MRARLEVLLDANASPRCGARSKRTGKPCRDAAMPNGRCKLHGGKSTGAYLHRQVQMVNTSCASRTPLSGCRPTDNNCSRTPCAACTNDMEIRIGVPDSLHNPSRRAASFTAGPITVKSRRSAVQCNGENDERLHER